jgi:hypothetical protein
MHKGKGDCDMIGCPQCKYIAMTATSKPREFWADENDLLLECPEENSKSIIQVMPILAYEALEARCEKYEKALNNIDDHIRQMYVDKIIDMKEMVRALKVISDAIAKNVRT